MSDYYLLVTASDDSRLLARVAGLIARLGLALKSLSLASSGQSGICRMSFVLVADPGSADLLYRMLSRLIDVRTVELKAAAVLRRRKNSSYREMMRTESALPINA